MVRLTASAVSAARTRPAHAYAHSRDGVSVAEFTGGRAAVSGAADHYSLKSRAAMSTDKVRVRTSHGAK